MLRNSKISFVLVAISGLLLVGVYIYTLWASDRQRSEDLPVKAADVMVRDLRSFHKKRGGFPANLKDLEGIVWEEKEPDLFKR